MGWGKMSANLVNTDCNSCVLPEMLQNTHLGGLSKLGIGVICLDKRNKVLYCNKKFQALTGTMSIDLIGKDLDHISSITMKSISPLFNHLLSAKQSGDLADHVPVKIVTSDGSLRYLSCNFVPYFENGDSYNGVVCFLKDETIKTVCSNEYMCYDDELSISHLPFVSFVWKGDDVWSVEYVSDNIVQFGYGPDDLMSGKLSYADIIHPDHLDNVKESVDLCTGNHFSKEYMLSTANGESRWVLERSYAIRDEANKITHFHGAILDIDERKRFEQELKDMNLQNRSLSKLGEKALSCNNVNALMNYAVKLVANALNTKYCTIMEMLPDERFLLRYGYGWCNWLIGSVVVEKDQGSQAGYTTFSGKPVIVEDMSFETRFKIPRFLREHGILSGISVLIGSIEEPFGVLCVHSDRKRKFTEHEVNFLQSVSTILAETMRLRKSFSSLELYRNLMDHCNDYIMVLNAVSKNFIYVSDRIYHDLGYSESEIMSQNIFEPECFIKGLDMSEVSRKISAGGSLLVECEFVRKNGTSFHVGISFAFVGDEDNVYMVLIGRDISERRAFEEAIKEHSEQLEYSNEIKDMFADVTGHDLISSVSIIEGFVGYLSGIEDDEKKKHILDNISKGTEKLRTTIDSALAFARLNCSGDLDIQAHDLRYFVNSSLERLHPKSLDNNIKIILNSPEFCPSYVNPIIEEVFFNLVSNAIKYSPDDGEVTVDITEAGDKWKVSVSDLGPGISDEDKARIFGRFKRAGSADVNGKGLGLAIAKMALKCHGEELHVIDNEVGRGSTFLFTVRMSDEFESLKQQISNENFY